MQPATYVLASSRNGTLYIGTTSDLITRVWQHKQGLIAGFTQRYDVHRLVYFELHSEMLFAIAREKQLKRWKRQWKLKLIEAINPNWDDLYDELIGNSADQRQIRS
jgi:putative endonuclease